MFGPRVEPTNHTTPDPDVLFALLRRAVNEQITTVLMEVSSIALAQERLAPLKFDAVAFTSFSRDHLDFHGSMEEYLAQKLRLFSEHLKLGARIALSRPLVNLAAKSSPAHSTDRWSYDGQAHSATAGFQGVHYSLREASSNGAVYSLHRGVNVLTGRGPFLSALAWENFTAALLLSEAILGRTPDPRHWANLEAVPGRLERVRSARDTDVDVIVDYAHTPDALEKTLAELRPLTRGKLWCVFGCGGDRDRGKRPEMGLIAGRLADHVLLTSDNPRSEDPQSILDEIARGLDQRPFLSFVDRRAAITHAVHHATTGDVVLIAGKGHETYQMIGTNRVPFDDRLEARHALETRP
jgi:UDP-N-acetylmuramoyl-L-alanyl-D-glutamate--2,6-diaminopimelate ligase